MKFDKIINEILNGPQSDSNMSSEMKNTTITFSEEFIKEVKEKFEIDYGWEWENDKDFLNQFHDWIVSSALDLDR